MSKLLTISPPALVELNLNDLADLACDATNTLKMMCAGAKLGDNDKSLFNLAEWLRSRTSRFAKELQLLRELMKYSYVTTTHITDDTVLLQEVRRVGDRLLAVTSHQQEDLDELDTLRDFCQEFFDTVSGHSCPESVRPLPN